MKKVNMSRSVPQRLCVTKVKSHSLKSLEPPKEGCGVLVVKLNPCGHSSCAGPEGGLYSGHWRNGLPHGEGEWWGFAEGTAQRCRYKGSWTSGVPHGTGLLDYKDGTRYWGHWDLGRRHGLGALMHPNGNRYEGYWRDDHKEGTGRYFHKNTGQIQDGLWRAGISTASVIEDVDRGSAPAPTPYPIPELTQASLRLKEQAEDIVERKHRRVSCAVCRYGPRKK